LARVAVFGGSFNPIHYGHLLLADQVQEILRLDRVLFMPVGVPPHKGQSDLAPAPDRHAMVALAIAGHPGFAVSDLELRRPGASYTIETIQALRAAGQALRAAGQNLRAAGQALPAAGQALRATGETLGPAVQAPRAIGETSPATGDELYLIIGSETFLDLLSWKEPARVASLARLVIVPRAGSAFDPEGGQEQKVLEEIGQPRFVRATGPASAEGVLIVDAVSLPISASDLRHRASRGQSLAYRVPEAVIAYLRARGLYQEEAPRRD
jgi:nicotinate-nucleotide adenylyltransferase